LEKEQHSESCVQLSVVKVRQIIIICISICMAKTGWLLKRLFENRHAVTSKILAMPSCVS